jgi:hydroxymethylbilane synthase
VAEIDDAEAHRAVAAEREFLRELGSGCSVPAGAYARIDGGDIVIDAVMAAPDGSQVLRYHARGRDLSIGAHCARELRDHLGGRDLPGWTR